MLKSIDRKQTELDPSLYTSSMLKSIDRQQTDLKRLCSIRMLPPEDCKYNQLKLKLVKTLLESKRKGEFTQDIQQLETMLDSAIRQEKKITSDFSHLLPPAKKVAPIPDIKYKQWTQLAKPGPKPNDLDKELSSLSSNFLDALIDQKIEKAKEIADQIDEYKINQALSQSTRHLNPRVGF
jgi:hypothetical protein